jgi:hypothetical protein
MAHEFDKSALDRHNYPTWAFDFKISLVFKGLLDHIYVGGNSSYAIVILNNPLYVIDFSMTFEAHMCY